MKSKLFPLISILILVILFGTAATCNTCGINLSNETTSSVTTNNKADDSSSQGTEEETANQATKEETVVEATEETKGTDNSKSTDSKTEVPTIKLQMYEGPTYSQTDDVCYYRIEATVTGSPSPTITFSKDDSNGSFGSKKVQINLTKANPNYTLTAKAKNSAG
ncbi:MAG: hypothetical protein ACYCXK_03785 [Candidatus Humimicrobiaceae bacterium]